MMSDRGIGGERAVALVDIKPFLKHLCYLYLRCLLSDLLPNT